MTLSPATPEWPVRDLDAALTELVERLGYTIAWHRGEEGIAGCARGDCALFLRQGAGEVAPGTAWVFVEEIDAFAEELKARGAEIAAPLLDKPWGLRQMTVRLTDGHLLHFHHDL